MSDLHRKIERKINRELENEIRQAISSMEMSKVIAGKASCEQCGSPVMNPKNFLCSDDCADLYWKLSEKGVIV